MKQLIPCSTVAIVLLCVGHALGEHHAATGSITTSYVAGAAADGNMFDVTTFSNPVTVSGIHVNASNSLKPLDIAIYTKPGTFHEFETEETAWALVSQTTVTPQGLNVPTIVDVTDFVLPANTITGIYVTVTDTGPGEPQMHYVVGLHEFSNADLRLNLGVGIGGMFEYSIEDRTWSGTINYTVDVAP
ncbi:MAG TPA: hypothetical protein EYN74_00690 [Nitrospirales bacterium]|nr:hypothetical protein [Nitrospirales bacterium]HIN33347.1 hypothetical protein [Nitrospirales bacterium]